jgi:hypothetical protein
LERKEEEEEEEKKDTEAREVRKRGRCCCCFQGVVWARVAVVVAVKIISLYKNSFVVVEFLIPFCVCVWCLSFFWCVFGELFARDFFSFF